MKRKAVGFIFALLVLAVFLYGCGGGGGSHSNPAAPNNTGLARISGIVTDSKNKPVDNAVVRLSLASNSLISSLSSSRNNSLRLANSSGSNTEYTTTTDKEGHYTFTNVPFNLYTLYSNINSNEAFIKTIAVEQTDESVEIKTMPFGYVTGQVTYNSKGVAGALVCLEETIYSVSDNNGNYKLDYVPVNNTSTPYNLKVYFSGYELDSKSNNVDCSLNNKVNNTDIHWQKNLSLLATKKASCTVKVSLDSSASILNPVYIFAKSSESGKLFVSVIDTNKANCDLNITEDGTYYIYAVSSSQEFDGFSITVSNFDTETKHITLPLSTPATVATGKVTGNITISDDYKELITTDEGTGNPKLNPPDVGKYLVRLIGVGNTNYSTSIKADYSIDQISSNYTFENVPNGTYKVLVDPDGEGNGFVGSTDSSQETITVTGGEVTANLTVEFVKPIFEVENIDGDSIPVNFSYPIFAEKDIIVDEENGSTISNTHFFCRNISTDSISEELVISSEGVYYLYLFLKKWGNPLTNNGTYEIIVQRTWTCNGFTGTITGTSQFEYNGAKNYIGNIKVNKTSITPEGFVSDLGPSFYTDANNKTYISLFGGNPNYHSKEVSDSSFKSYSISSSLNFSEIYEVANCHSVYGYTDTNTSDNTTYLYYYNSSSANDLPFTYEKDNEYLGGVSVITNNDANPDVLIAYASKSTNLNHPQIVKLTYSSTESKYVVDKRISLSNSPHTENALKKSKNYVALSTYNETSTVLIFNVNEFSENTITCYIPESYDELNDFQVLNNGNFYIEVTKYISDTPHIYSYIYNSNSNGELIDKDVSTERKSCVMDKYGFMYRFDEAIKVNGGESTSGIVKTTSLGGDPIATLTEIDSEEINGIIALEGDVLYAY